MKKHISVFMLCIRATLLPMLLVLILASVIQTVMFSGELENVIAISQSRTGESVYGLESVFGWTSIPLVSAAALILLTVILYIPGTAFGSQTSYTLSRLQISEKSVFVWQAVYNSLALLLFWAAQAILMFALCKWYDISLETSTNQTVFLALYRDEFLHSMLPLHEISRSIRNIAFCIGLGATTAYGTHKQRTGKPSFIFALMLLYVIRAFGDNMGNLGMDITHTVTSLVIAVFGIAWILTDGFEFLFREE